MTISRFENLPPHVSAAIARLDAGGPYSRPDWFAVRQALHDALTDCEAMLIVNAEIRSQLGCEQPGADASAFAGLLVAKTAELQRDTKRATR